MSKEKRWKLDLTNYNFDGVIKSEEGAATIQSMPFDVKKNIMAVVMNGNLKIANNLEFGEYLDLKHKILECKEDFILLTSEELALFKKGIDSFPDWVKNQSMVEKLYGRLYVKENGKYVFKLPEVEVEIEEKKKDETTKK